MTITREITPMTSTDVAVQRGDQHQLAALVPTPSEAVHAALEQWVGGLAASVQGAEYIVDTPLCPDSMWPLPPGTQLSKIPGKNPKVPLPNEDRESYLARRRVASYSLGGIVRYGLQLGIPPEVATQGLFVIGGRVSMYADQMVALVKSKGHQHRILERTGQRCRIEIQRSGEQPQEFTYTIEDAIQNGYVPGKGPNEGAKWPDGNPKLGGNEKYLLDPAGMLEARCNTTGLTAVFPDVLRGLVSVEAMRDEQAIAAVTVTVDEPAPSAKVTAAEILGRSKSQERRVELSGPLVREAAASVALDRDQTHSVDSGPAQPEPQPEPTPISEMLWRGINDELRELGVNGDGSRGRRLTLVNHLIGRTVGRGSEMTHDEGRLVYDTLRGGGGARLLADVFGEAAPAPIVEAVVDPQLPGQDAAEFDPTAEDENWGSDAPDLDEQ